MEKSKDFILNRIKNYGFGFEDTDYSKLQEINFTIVLDLINDNIKSLYREDRFTYVLKSEDSKGKSNVEIIYNQYGEFEYFTIESCVCDGTLYFATELMPKILYKIFNLQTVNKETVPNDLNTNLFDYDIRYTVGNFVFNDEFGDFGTEEKPWMQSRFTMMLPVKCEFIRKEQ